MSLLTLLQTQSSPPEPAPVSGTLSLAGGVTMQVLTPVALAGTLTMSGSLAAVLRTVQALAGTLTSSGVVDTAVRLAKAVTGSLSSAGSVDSTYVPPGPGGDDALTTRFRRNQTD